MPTSRFAEQLNRQVGHEFAAHQQYVAIAVYYDSLTMPATAAYFYEQAMEERSHAMMMVRFLLDTEREVSIPGTDEPQCRFDDIVAPVALALAQEQRVTTQIHDLTRIARDEDDLAAEQFMQWFVKEQVEECAGMRELLAVVGRGRDDIPYVEAYAARRDPENDPTAPTPAGA
jgi:ferritin